MVVVLDVELVEDFMLPSCHCSSIHAFNILMEIQDVLAELLHVVNRIVLALVLALTKSSGSAPGLMPRVSLRRPFRNTTESLAFTFCLKHYLRT